ncbi:MAG: 2-C-methyl-D-erythritol 4-phosphate cytidylyltransferase [Heliobacteriaceae bacterium]|jgi:2-C-methyl-D-erythritol 4-phosphate cytidylyltransferase|nr:2-C-methyl-D-erythritol 4-phosphate cytidylyltransferase [Heliobacteriaceae bacterium]
MTTFKVNAIITAGGASSRFGSKNKLLEKIHGKEVIRWTAEAFERSNVNEIIICANPAIMEDLKKIFSKNIKIIEGGTTRQESVFNGLKVCKCDYVLIHDGARPVISPEDINRAVEMTIEKHAMTAAAKTIDTIKEVENGVITRTISREKLYNTQTPQGFEYNLIKAAHEKFAGDNFTDDAGMVEALGKPVYILEGSHKNIKITTPEDIAAAEVYLSCREGNCPSFSRPAGESANT